MPVRFPEPLEAGDVETEHDVVVDGSTKSIGKLRAASGTWGLALLRTEHAAAAARDKRSLILKGTDIVVEAYIPAWWPSEGVSK